MVVLLEGLGPHAARQPRAFLLLHDREELGLLALVSAPASLDLHRRSPGVGLEAAATTARAWCAIGLDHHVSDLASSAASEPELVVDDDAAADARTAEDSEHRRVGASRAELGLGHDPHLHVVGQFDGYAEGRAHGSGDSDGAEPVGQVARVADGARIVVDLPG